MNRLWISRQWFSRVFGKASRIEWFHHRAHRRGRWACQDWTGFGLAAETLEDRLLLSTITVDDDGNGDQTSIQAAIDAAVAGDVILINGGADRIHTEAGILINKDLTIQGATGATQVVVQAAAQAGVAQDRVFSVASQTIATIDSLTIRHGVATDVSFAESGGGIFNAGFLTINNSTITQNSSQGDGGGISNSNGGLAINDTTISDNTATGAGGGLANFLFVEQPDLSLRQTGAELSPGMVHISNSTIADNSAGTNGGGIQNASGAITVEDSTIAANVANSDGGGFRNGGMATISRSTISGNSAGDDGGGIDILAGGVILTNSTVSGNSAGGDGGGIRNLESLVITNSTIVLNRANAEGGEGFGSGGGIFTFDAESGPFTRLLNTIVAGNTVTTGDSANDVDGENVSADSAHNLIGDPGSAGGLVHGSNGNIVGQSDGIGGRELLDLSTLLDPILADNGGPTLTHDLLLGSPAVDAGSNSLAVGPDEQPLATDQRGFPRVFDIPGVPNATGGVDIGAVELTVAVFDIVALDADKSEGLTPFTFLVTRSGDTAGDAFVDFFVSPGTVDEADFTGGIFPSGMVHFGDGETEQIIQIDVQDDPLVEPDEIFFVQLSNPSTGVINTAATTGTILNDDATTISIDDVSANESAGTMTFTVSLSNPISQEVTVEVTTVDVTATSAIGPGQDYVPIVSPMTITFTPGGSLTQTVTVTLVDDNAVEPNETFEVHLANPLVNGEPDDTQITIDDGTGVGTILNDDATTISIDDVSANESAGTMTFTVSLSNPISQEVTVEVTTVDVTATSAIGPGQDYVPIVPPLMITFTPGGSLTQTVTVTLVDDDVVEEEETFEVHLANPLVNGEPADTVAIGDATGVGTILNDEIAAISISDASARERDGLLTFTITMSKPLTEDVHIDLRSRDLTASSLFGEGQDYIPLPPDIFVTLAPGELSIGVEIQINDDLVLEPNETFEVNIVDVRIGQGPIPPTPYGNDGSTRVVVSDGTGIGTILNDENIQVFGAGNGNGIESMPPVVIVELSETGTELSGFENFLAYDGAFRGGVRVAAADVNGDGVAEVITAPGPGGGPHIRVFDGLTAQSIADFFAYDSEFLGGVFVAAADVNADGFADIITGAGAGGGPHVRVFSGRDFALLHNFFAYDEEFAGGVSVAAGQLNPDGFADIITGAGAGGGPHVRVFDGRNADLLEEFFAYDPDFLGGISVTSGDVNGDGLAEIITGAGRGGGPHVRVFDGQNPGQVLSEFFAYDPNVTFGLFVGTTDTDDDGLVEVLIGTGPGPSEVRLFDSTGVLLNEFISVFNPHFHSGAHVAGSVTLPSVLDSYPTEPFPASSLEIEEDLLGQVFDESTMDALLFELADLPA